MPRKLTATSLTRADSYHTDPDCRILTKSPREPREVSESAIAYHDLDECTYCQDMHPGSPVDGPTVELPGGDA